MPNQNRTFYVVSGLALSLWLVIFYQGIATAVDVWFVSEIFNHCFFVLPFCLFLIYQKRSVISVADIKPTLLPIIPLTGAVFLQLFALVGDIKILMHIATFTSLPLLIWLLVGHKVAKILAFPLFFILFCIPIGDQLIPYLQELTTDISVPLLEFTNVPIYRNGLYLDIPEGRFLVAEACSGISFLISSIVFGFAYAYVSFTSIKKRAIFVVVSVLVPILANALRVYGIVLTGHLSDMQYAVGADHLIYGGVFYTIVLFILILLGERFRDKKPPVVTEPETTSQENETEKSLILSNFNVKPVVCFILVALGQQIWLYNISQFSTPEFTSPKGIVSHNLPYQVHVNKAWSPELKGADKEILGMINLPNSSKKNIETYIAYYNGVGGELISSEHRLYGDKQWSLIGHQNKIIAQQPFTLTELASQFGERRYLLHWYEINGKHFNSASKTKLYQAYLMLLGKNASGVKIILTVSKEYMLVDELISTTEKNLPEIRSTLYQALADK
ncbi:exosortase A [Thalassotalea agariperforans]